MIKKRFVGICFGSCTESTTALEQSRKRNTERRAERGQKISEVSLWTPISNEMEATACTSRSSQKSISSIGVTNQATECRGSNPGTHSTDFVNHGLMLWTESRKQWVGNLPKVKCQPKESVILWTTAYDELLGTSRPFNKPIPLVDMVDFLCDVWEQEGLYD